MIRKILKWFGLIILLLIIGGASFIGHEWYADKPIRFKSYVDRTMVKMAFDSPETLTSLGFLEGIGIKGHNADLDDASIEKANELFDMIPTIRQGVAQYADDELEQSDRTSKEIALYLLDFANEAKQFRYHNYPVNQLFGIQNGFPSFMDAQHQVNTIEDVDNYISRLSQVNRKFTQSLESLKLIENKGIIPPRFVIDRVLDEMQDFIAKPVKENILYVSLKDKMDKVQEAATVDNESVFSKEEQTRILADVEEIMHSSVHPAYQLFINYFKKLREKSNTDDGFWKHPDGDKAYASSLKFFTTTDYSADFIHDTGLSEVTRLQSEILSILAKESFDISGGFTPAIEILKNQEKFYYPDTDDGRQKILADYQVILDEISSGLDDAFNIRPKAGMKVRRIPEFKEKTAPGAYYQQPAIDGSRPGMFFANLYDIKSTPKYAMRTLAYHEGIPGHHFQIAIAMEAEGLPLFRKMSPFTAYTEGWALYAEQVAWELGFQNDPFDNIGRLQAELFRAVRLVVDTGIHHKRWTREESIDYMLKNTGMAKSDVVSEIERYIVMPGQATSYKVGMMKILEIREDAKRRLGDKFNLPEFHDVVLQNGAVPLDILAKIVDNYVNEKLK
ncbi:DUF885 domain-containing protein [Pseudoalteromonas sp. NBT06-2]|uniref:DUF885 domain-containing protein n=1 Tax=Pseudoalteromonas sp. NBT06-2 TaxID=2025950 RepID=UPI000BA57B95|nr:DUF885 domain-containing protein [Pseudoalteromonas sp. NBT06-2]PAJ72534.1 DUF885 domain-containing protein [Pseudoalteromonas sp. NBT06-2]